MVFLFKFYEDGKGIEYKKLDLVDDSHKTNKKYFSLKILLSTIKFDINSVTDFNLRMRRDNGTNYYHTGYIDKDEQCLKFDNCEFKDISYIDGEYETFLEFYSGGILIYDGSTENLLLNLATTASEYTISLDNSKNTAGIIEMQQTDGLITELQFEFKMTSNAFNDYYAYYFSNTEEAKEYIYKPFVAGTKLTQMVTPTFFKEGKTYLFTSMKDAFGNIKTKKFQIITKSNTTHYFKIIECTDFITNVDSTITTYFESINVERIRPVIKYEKNSIEHIIKATNEIGLLQNQDNVLSFSFKDAFGIENSAIENIKLFDLYYEINGTLDQSNHVTVIKDSNIPIITCYGFDKNGYQLIKTNISKYKIEGTVDNSNMFFVSNDTTVGSITNCKKITYLTCTTPIDKVSFIDVNDVEYELFPIFLNKDNVRSIYKVETETLIDYKSVAASYDDVDVPVEYLSDFHGPDQKVFFVSYDFDKLDTYTQNIITSNGGIVFSGPITTKLLKTQYIKFGKYIYLKGYIPSSEISEVDFDILVKNTTSSLIKETFSKNVSCNLKHNKDLVLDFVNTSIIGINSSIENELIKIFGSVYYTSYPMLPISNIQIATVSGKTTDAVKCKGINTYINTGLNDSSNVKTYFIPTLKKNNAVIEYTDYKVAKLSDTMYSFEFNVEITNGMNDISISFVDLNNNEGELALKLEKNINEVNIVLNKYQDNASITFSNDECFVNSLEENTVLQLDISGETYTQLNSERYIKVKDSNGYSTQYRVITKQGSNKSFVILEMSNLKENYEKMTIYYDDEIIYSFSIKKTEQILLTSELAFTSGSNVYYLKYMKDAISQIYLDWDNKEYFSCKIVDNNFIEIKKIKETQKAEINLSITSYDPNNIYPSSVFVSSGLFYTSTVIKNEFLYYNGARQSPSISIPSSVFNLELECFNNIDIEEIYVNDYNEFLYGDIKKKAYYDSDKNCFIISNIITPTIYSDIVVYIKTTYLEFELTYNAFSKNKIIYDYDNTTYSMSFSGINENYNLQIGSSKSTTTNIVGNFVGSNYIQKIELFLDGELIFTETPNYKFSNINSYYKTPVSIDKNISGLKEINCKITDGAGRIRYTKNIFYNINNFDTLLEITNIKEKNIGVKGQTIKINVKATGYKPNTYSLYYNIEDIFGNITKVLIQEGENLGTFFNELGLFKTYITLQSGTFELKSKYYYFDINDVGVKHVSLFDNAYSRIKKIFEIKFLKNTFYENNILSSKLNHYHAGKLIAEYYPIYNQDNNFTFKIKKLPGLNRYEYEDNFLRFFIDDCTIQISDLIKPQMLKFETYDDSSFEYIGDDFLSQEKSMNFLSKNNVVDFEDSNDVFTLERNSNVRLTYVGVDTIQILSKNGLILSEKKCLDGIYTNIESLYIPCTIEHFDANGVKLNNLTFDIEVRTVDNGIVTTNNTNNNSFVGLQLNINNNEENGSMQAFYLTAPLNESFKTSISLLCKRYEPHYMLEYARIIYREKHFSFDLKLIDDIISTIEMEYNLQKNNISHVTFFKKEIYKKMEELNNV